MIPKQFFVVEAWCSGLDQLSKTLSLRIYLLTYGEKDQNTV